ncbi:MAG TPA: hypothetical protein DDZ40_13895 [Deltaproteobacteria bacterium]|nr:hypothetical protein [Deltaproteobacteria bacterium]
MEDKPIYYDNTFVLKVTRISNDRLQYFIRLGLIEPAVPGFGRGKGHKYDDANLKRIAILFELDQLGVDAGTIKKVIFKAPPLAIGTVADPTDSKPIPKKKNILAEGKLIPRTLAIFKDGNSLSVKWFPTAADAYAYFYPKEGEGEGASPAMASSVILVDTVRVWLDMELRKLDASFESTEKLIKRLQKAGKKVDPGILPIIERIRASNKLTMKGEFKRAKEVHSQLKQDLLNKIEKRK